MRILVVHQVPFRKVGYDAVLDHNLHDVTYIGQPKSLGQVPDAVRHDRLATAEGEATDDRWFAAAVREALEQDGPDAVDAVVSLSEFGHYAAAAAQAHYGLPARPDVLIERVRDKVVMKGVLERAGVPTPAYISGASALAQATWKGRTVLKPRTGASSAGVQVFDTLAEAAAAAHGEGSDDLELEEFVDGSVLHVDGFVVEGQLVNAVPAECLGSPLEYAQGAVIGSVQISAPDAIDLARRAVRALAIDRGAIHLELFRRPDGSLVFLEVGHRVGGAGILTAYRRRTGIDLAAREILDQAGLPPREPDLASGDFHGFLLGGYPLSATGRAYVDTNVRPGADEVYLNAAEAKPDSYQEWEVPLFVEISDADPHRLRTTAAQHCSALNAQRETPASHTTLERTPG